MPTVKGPHATEPLTPGQALEAALHWYVWGTAAKRDAQHQEGLLLPHGDVTSHYDNWALWVETSRQMWIALPHELRKQYDERLGPLLATFRNEGTIVRIIFCQWGEEVLVRTEDGYKEWLYTKHMNVPDFHTGQYIYWNTSFVYGQQPGGGNEVLAVLRRPSTDEVECLREQLKDESGR